MTAVVWANILLAIPFLIAFIGVPLWMTFKRPQTRPDHAQAHAYLRTKAALAATAAAPATNGAGTGRLAARIAAARIAARRRGAAAPHRDHARNPVRRASTSA